MMLAKRIALKKDIFYVYKTGLPFFDSARLIGVAHLFFGTASAEIEDKGVYWEVRGVKVARDLRQVNWILEEGKAKSYDLKQKWRQLRKALEEMNKNITFKFCVQSPDIKLPKKYPALKEFDASLQYGPRGIDPMKDPVVISSQGTKPKRPGKQYLLPANELIVSSIGFSFSAYVRSGDQRTYILPIFDKHIVLSGFLTYQRNFRHSASGFVGEILACLSILLDLTIQKIPVLDFAYTRIFGRNIFSSSGYLGLEKLCSYWWQKAVQENNQDSINFLENIRQFLQNTSGININEQVQALARWVADFVANPNVDTLAKIEHLKARILSASQTQNIQGSYAVRRLLNKYKLIKEAKNMISENLPDVPFEVTQALAYALNFDEKGWMNQFTRLENAPNFSQFIREVERIISRGYYRAQQEKGKQTQEVFKVFSDRDKELAKRLLEIESKLRDDKNFRAWKSIFLLNVLSQAHITSEESSEEAQTT